MRPNMPIMDSQRALSFLIPQLTHIEREVYRVKYPAIRYHRIIPVATEGNEWAPSVTYFSMDGVGQAGWFSANGMDIPNSDLVRSKFENELGLVSSASVRGTQDLQQEQLVLESKLHGLLYR